MHFSVSAVDVAEMTGGYVALREHAAWVDLSTRGKIRATGEDRARLLHAMTTNQVEQLRPGEGCYAFFLNAQGRILGDVNLLCFEEHFLLDTEPETRRKLFDHLDRYIIADDVTIEDETDHVTTIAVEGPDAAAVLSRLGALIPEKPHAWAAWDSRTVARLNTTGSEGFFVFTSAADKAELISRLSAAGAVAASADDARTVRIEHGRPRYGEEITERRLVQETAQLHAVHFSKGCYLGQEIVERVRSRGQVHRVLRRLEINSSKVPAPGTKLAAGDGEAAEIASAVFSPALDETVALAYVRVQYAERGTELSWNDVKVCVS
jgi:aminomethyltransferase